MLETDAGPMADFSKHMLVVSLFTALSGLTIAVYAGAEIGGYIAPPYGISLHRHCFGLFPPS